MPEKIDPLKLAEELEAKLGVKMEQELSAGKVPEATAQPEQLAVLPVEETETMREPGLTQEAIDALLRGLGPEKGEGTEEKTGEPKPADLAEKPATDLGAGLNPSQPPFTEREEKTEAAEKFVAPEQPGVSEKTPIDLTELVERPGASEKSAIELTEVVEEPEKKSERDKEIEAALAKAREEYVEAEAAMAKAEKEEVKLSGVRLKLNDIYHRYFAGHKEEEYKRSKEEKIGGAQAEAQEAKDRFLKAQEKWEAAIKMYRDEEVGKLDKKSDELKAAGKTEEEIKSEMENIAREILLATTLREAAKMDSLKSQKQFEQMGKSRQYINEKAEEFTEWYKALKPSHKIAVSAALGVGGVAGAFMGLTSIIPFIFAGQVGLRILGSGMTTGLLSKKMESSREKLAEKRMSKEFEGRFLKALRDQEGELNDKIFERLSTREDEKVGRFILAGTMGALVGGGALAQVFRNGLETEFGHEMTGRIRDVAGRAIDWVRHPLSGGFDVDKEILRMQGEAELLKAGGGPKGPGATGVEGAAVEAGGVAVKAQEIINLPIGDRGPEGAIIDNFRAKPELAKSFGWDEKTPLSKWAGTKAHQLWLASVEGELVKPGMADKLTEQGFTADAEGYAKAMGKIGKGFVEIAPTGEVQLTDNTTFLKAGAPAFEGLDSETETHIEPSILNTPESSAPSVEAPSAPSVPSAPAETLSSGARVRASVDIMPTKEELEHINIKETVEKFVVPEILNDKTFKAAANVTLGKILEEVPPEIYQDKLAVSGSFGTYPNLDLPGSGWLGLTYDDFRKYAEMAKFLRENPVLKSAVGLNNMTVEEFFKIYGGDLGKGAEGQTGAVEAVTVPAPEVSPQLSGSAQPPIEASVTGTTSVEQLARIPAAVEPLSAKVPADIVHETVASQEVATAVPERQTVVIDSKTSDSVPPGTRVEITRENTSPGSYRESVKGFIGKTEPIPTEVMTGVNKGNIGGILLNNKYHIADRLTALKNSGMSYQEFEKWYLKEQGLSELSPKVQENLPKSFESFKSGKSSVAIKFMLQDLALRHNATGAVEVVAPPKAAIPPELPATKGTPPGLKGQSLVEEPVKVTAEEAKNTAKLGKPVIGGVIPEEVRKAMETNIKNSPLLKLTGKSLEQIQSLDSSGQEELITKMKSRLEGLSSKEPSSPAESGRLKKSISELKAAIDTLEKYKDLINKK